LVSAMCDVRCAMFDMRCAMCDAISDWTMSMSTMCDVPCAMCHAISDRCAMIDDRCAMIDDRCAMERSCAMCDVGRVPYVMERSNVVRALRTARQAPRCERTRRRGRGQLARAGGGGRRGRAAACPLSLRAGQRDGGSTACSGTRGALCSRRARSRRQTRRSCARGTGKVARWSASGTARVSIGEARSGVCSGVCSSVCRGLACVAACVVVCVAWRTRAGRRR
jgi:hypothetical protein